MERDRSSNNACPSNGGKPQLIGAEIHLIATQVNSSKTKIDLPAVRIDSVLTEVNLAIETLFVV